jgi:hypothetical protein
MWWRHHSTWQWAEGLKKAKALLNALAVAGASMEGGSVIVACQLADYRRDCFASLAMTA